MRLKLGLLQDPAAIDRQIARELKEVEKARQKAAIPTVQTEAEVKAEESFMLTGISFDVILEARRLFFGTN